MQYAGLANLLAISNPKRTQEPRRAPLGLGIGVGSDKNALSRIRRLSIIMPRPSIEDLRPASFIIWRSH